MEQRRHTRYVTMTVMWTIILGRLALQRLPPAGAPCWISPFGA